MTLEIPDAYERAADKTAFSNSTAWEIWADRNCYRCVNDGMGLGKVQPQCPLIEVALLGRTPAEWTDQGLQDYLCIYFRDRDDPGGREPKPVPDPPGQATMWPREPFESALKWAGTMPRQETADA